MCTIVDKFKNEFAANAASLFGPSWRSTLGGYAQLFVVSAYHAYLLVEGKPLTLSDVIQILVSAIFAVVLKCVKDEKHIDVPQDVADAAKKKVISTLDGLLIKPVVVVPPVVAAPSPPVVAVPPAPPAPAAPVPTVPPSPPVPAPTAPVSGFTPDGPNALIRGNFVISSEKLESLCVGQFAPYKQYAQAIVEDGLKYGINPLFILADFVNQGVNPAYNNPWGISTDNYPYGPNGSQLGEANGHVKNGPRKFSESEWRIAFDRQFAIVATGKVYSSAKTIAEWALIDAPPGAENDVHGTNDKEGVDVGEFYNKLVKAL